jgi:TrmH family RNA methyltransferase
VRVSARVFARISARRHPDGVAAVVETPSLRLDDLPTDDRVALVADAVEKPGNVGAMVRTADAFGASFIGASLGTDLVNPNVVRSAQGSLFACPLATAPRGEVIPWCVRRGPIVVASPDADRSLWETDLTGPVSIVVGSEHRGVDPAWYEIASAATIPTSGTADSLNASVAAAIFLAEASRQRSD